ncbi:MAG: hypothetical protein ACRC2T_06820, partial [Thermoguttaceae bacterium]
MNQKNKTNILFLVDQIWSGKGGSEQHLLWLLRKLPDSEVTKHLIVFTAIREASEEVFPVKPLVLGKQYGEGRWAFYRRFFALVRFIQENKIDIIHAFTVQDELVANLACVFARRGKVCGHRRNIGYALDTKTKFLSKIVQRF